MSSSLTKMALFDQYSRYKACADVLRGLNKPIKILDVGCGEECLLESLLPNYDITFVDPLLARHSERTSNKIAGDVFSNQLDGYYFDSVVSIDTLEHVEPMLRDRFLERLIRLASKGVLIAFPCQDKGDATETDRWINNVYSLAFGEDYLWLEEHFKFGLPVLDDVIKKFEKRGLKTLVQGNGHTSWLKELLSLIVCVWEIEELKPIALELSAYFNENLAQFDHLEPSYRQIVFASHEPSQFVSPKKELTQSERLEASRRWEYIKQRVIALPLKFLLGAQPLLKLGTSSSQTELRERDSEILRLNTLISQASEWGQRSSVMVKERDGEIQRLNELLEEITAWAKESAQLVEDRDKEIIRLNTLLKEQAGS